MTNWSLVYGCYKRDKITRYPTEQLPLTRALKGEEVKDELIFIKNSKQSNGIWISISASPLRDESGTIMSGIIIFRDVTERRQDLEELKRFANGVEQTADSIVVTNTQGVIEYVNPAFVHTTGFKSKEVMGQTPRILNSGKHDKIFYKNMWDTISNGQSYRGTIVNKKKNGDIYWSDQSISPIKDKNGNITSFVSVLKDITELRQKQDYEFQLNIAHQIQQFYLNAEINIPGFDISGVSFPAEKIGGDYFDFIQMPDGCVAIAIGDVTGHGIGAALIMAETRAFLRSFTKLENDPAKILTQLNAELLIDLQPEQFVTLMLARLNPSDCTLEYASAGHDPAYLLNSSGKIDSVLESTGLPLGFLKNPEISNSNIIKLKKDNIAVFFTDGIREAESPDGQEFEIDRALDIVKSNKQSTARQIIELLHENIKSFSKGQPQEDDITSVIVKVN